MRARLAVDVREDVDASVFFLLCELDAAACANELSFSRSDFSATVAASPGPFHGGAGPAAFAAEAICAEALATGVGALAGFEIAAGCVFEVWACCALGDRF